MTRRALAALLRTQKAIFQTELYHVVTDEEDDDEYQIQQRIYDAVVSTFEICAKIVEGTKAVGAIDPGAEGMVQ